MTSGSPLLFGSYRIALARNRTTGLEEARCEFLGKDSNVQNCELSIAYCDRERAGT